MIGCLLWELGKNSRIKNCIFTPSVRAQAELEISRLTFYSPPQVCLDESCLAERHQKMYGQLWNILKMFDIRWENIIGVIYLSAISEIAVKKLNLELSPNVLSLASLLS